MEIFENGYVTDIYLSEEEMESIPESMKHYKTNSNCKFIMYGEELEEKFLEGLYGKELPPSDWFMVYDLEDYNSGD